MNKSAWAFYASQNNFASGAEIPFLDQPEYIVLGKSLVPAPPEADVLSGVGLRSLSYAPPQSYDTAPPTESALELGGPWAFYREFFPAHGISFLNTLFPLETGFIPGHRLWVPLLLRNNSASPATAVLHGDLPAGWTTTQREMTYALEPGTTLPVQLFLQAPSNTQDKAQQMLHWSLSINGKHAGSIDLAAYPEVDGLPQ